MPIKRATANQKGKNFEREIAEILSELSGVKYRRTPSSGAYRQEFPGDIMKSERRNSIYDGIVIECKNHKRLSIPEWIQQSKGEILDAGVSKFVIVFNIRGEKFFLMNEALFSSMSKKIRRGEGI